MTIARKNILKTFICSIVLMVIITGCTKHNNIPEFQTGTFQGVKIVSWFSTHTTLTDTMTIELDKGTYSYSTQNSLNTLPDYGRGTYSILSGSVEFNDDEARIALYTWDWILGGKYEFAYSGDSLVLIQKFSYKQISCKLKRINFE
jgi:hypothetical protein